MAREKEGKGRWAQGNHAKPFKGASDWSRLRTDQKANRARVHAAGVSRNLRSGASLQETETPAKGQMMKHLREIGDFVRRFPMRARFGDLSRARLRLLRFEVRDDKAECDWVARVQDEWDSGLHPRIRGANVSTQALKDAVRVRGLLFSALPKLCSAVVRVYRQSPEGDMELIITGTVNRMQPAPASVRSLVMRAKLLGLKFWIDDGILENLQTEEYAVSS